jgi:2-oxoisovalerate dehydrogenase E1 component alpha subunit
MKTYHVMAQARALEERLIKMSKSDDGYFWIGGPGEEAFNVPLGQLIHKGEGLAFDYGHFHYRQSATLLAMGMKTIDVLRQMGSRATDPFSGGRNFVNHPVVPEWNVMPVTSPIETQYPIATGTALAQKRFGGKGITIVTGGDAGTAEGDFASCLNFASRPGVELPMLIVVTNNRYGISTPYEEVHGDQTIAKRAGSFGIEWGTVNGNDPIESYLKLFEVMEHIRFARRPYCLEASVSRLHGHSSSSGGGRVEGELDCLEVFGECLQEELMIDADELKQIKKQYEDEILKELKQVRQEPYPEAHTMYDHVFAERQEA